MDSGKQGSSQTSSEESDQRVEQAKDDTVSTAKRSYECTFCKRGFTNAQALGGHMNIHRKDRAKAKQHPTTTSNSHSSKSQDEFLSASRSCNSSEPAKYYPIMEAQRASYQYACFQPPGPSPRQQQYGFYGSDPFLRGRAVSLCINEELLGANLRLGIGPAEMESNELMKRYIRKEDEIDLELRLGHHP